MIIVTGAAGFIGNNMVKKLNDHNFNDLILVDKFGDPVKDQHLKSLKFTAQIDRDVFFDWLDKMCFHKLNFDCDRCTKKPNTYFL